MFYKPQSLFYFNTDRTLRNKGFWKFVRRFVLKTDTRWRLGCRVFSTVSSWIKYTPRQLHFWNGILYIFTLSWNMFHEVWDIFHKVWDIFHKVWDIFHKLWDNFHEVWDIFKVSFHHDPKNLRAPWSSLFLHHWY